MKIPGWVRSRPAGLGAFRYLTAIILLVSLISSGGLVPAAAAQPEDPGIQGPFFGEPVAPYVYQGNLGELSALPLEPNQPAPLPLKYVPGTEPKGASSTIAGWIDPVAQSAEGAGHMPAPLQNFAGMSFDDTRAGWPPDTNGDVGPSYYIQVVNTSIAIYSKSDGIKLRQFTFDQFFQGTNTPCDTNNSGDPVVVYDRLADRWLISDFSLPGPYYECVAVSKTGDPVSGGWNMYGLKISDSSMNDYPKFGVWPDAYYMSANMFLNGQSWDGVQVWAFNRAEMLAGLPVRSVHFALGPATGYGSLLPSHLLTAPPAGSPDYFASVAPPGVFQLWIFHVDWANLANSTFTGPAILDIADFAIAASVPQKDSTQLLDSLSFRPMMQLQYRNIGGVESLWLTHTVASQGVSGVRWYEVRSPGGTPVVFQQGTYQPDLSHRWMGSLAVDRDGNMAVGYSVSSASLYPAIRYAGRLAGEIPGLLPQAEVSLIEGAGSQLLYHRWGDYSAMSVDPSDDCTFWYTTEYFASTGIDWQTRIGSFRFPSCGQVKGSIEGTIRDSVTSTPIPGVKVVAQSGTLTLSVLTDGSGKYQMTLPSGTYTLTAGPLPPGYPNPATVPNVAVAANNTTPRDLSLVPVPNLVGGQTAVNDQPPYGNGNGYPEPGEQGLRLTKQLLNTGATTATGVTAQLISLTPGVTVDTPTASYPDIAVGQAGGNTTPFVFSVSGDLPCGADLSFRLSVHSAQGNYTVDFSLNASVPQPRQDIFNNNVESGEAGWTTGGFLSQWAITTFQSHSPAHSWADSPLGNYSNNSDTYVQTPASNLAGKRHARLSGWFKYDLEAGYDFAYLEYSLDGGTTWAPDHLMEFNGSQPAWTQTTVDTPVLDNQHNVAFRFRLVTDAGVVGDGIYIDDVSLSYEPYQCSFVPRKTPDAPTLVFPDDNGFDYNPVAFAWKQGNAGYTPTGYRLTLDNTSVFTITYPLTSTIVPALSLGDHTWNVTAFNAEGSSPPSETRTVEVLAEQAGLPGVPTLLSPANGGSSGLQMVTFHWVADRNAGTPDGYTFVLDGTHTITLTGRIDKLTLYLAPGTHTWTVRAENEAGSSLYATPWTFRVPYLIFAPFVHLQ